MLRQRANIVYKTHELGECSNREPLKDKRLPHQLYVITDDRGHCKVGITTMPMGRLDDIQTSNPHKLRIVAHWVIGQRQEAYDLEQTILSDCKKHAMCGEWLATEYKPLVRYILQKHGNLLALMDAKQYHAVLIE